jgi:NAD(P)-dependent dehydrogenase (short-subunit alcohol dehydrogenase family)
MNKSAVLITGGPTVIGSAAAVAFAKKDARVVAAGRRDEAGKALVKELRRFGSAAEFINADVLRMTFARWSMSPSHGLAVSMSR